MGKAFSNVHKCVLTFENKSTIVVKLTLFISFDLLNLGILYFMCAYLVMHFFRHTNVYLEPTLTFVLILKIDD